MHLVTLITILILIALFVTFYRSSRLSEKKTTKTSQPMTNIDEARTILGLEKETLTKEAIIQRHRQLMQKVHPDQGGNHFLASQVNDAKETLLKYIEKS